MRDYQRAFIEFAIEQQVLRFGEFTLKSGRTSPYFFNAGQLDTGLGIATLSQFYADAIVDQVPSFDVMFGPAYKGIPIAAATATQLFAQHGRDVPWCYNRKEAKDHGEGGTMVGAPLVGDVLVVDDVITAGTAIREVAALIDAAGARLGAVVVAIDRRERGRGELSAIQEVEAETGASVHAIVTVDHVIEHLEATGQFAEHLPAVREYRREFGVS